MTIQIWHREVPYNTIDGIKMMTIMERYDLELLQRVREAKRRPVKSMDEAIPLTWKESLLFAFVSLFGTALWYIVIAEAAR